MESVTTITVGDAIVRISVEVTEKPMPAGVAGAAGARDWAGFAEFLKQLVPLIIAIIGGFAKNPQAAGRQLALLASALKEGA